MTLNRKPDIEIKSLSHTYYIFLNELVMFDENNKCWKLMINEKQHIFWESNDHGWILWDVLNFKYKEYYEKELEQILLGDI